MASGIKDTATEHWKENVRLNYKGLVQDTDLYLAVDECFSIGIFKEEERDEIQSERIKHEKNRHFLNLLLHKSRSLFDKFMKSDFLNSEQNLHIKELLDVANVQTTKPRTESDVETNLQRRKIFRSYEKIIRTTTLRFMIDDFIAERVFDLEDYENIRTSDKNTHKENRRFLNILLTKHAGYQLLLNMLRETDHHDLASQIEQENVDEDDDKEIKEFLSKQKQAGVVHVTMSQRKGQIDGLFSVASQFIDYQDKKLLPGIMMTPAPYMTHKLREEGRYSNNYLSLSL